MKITYYIFRYNLLLPPGELIGSGLVQHLYKDQTLVASDNTHLATKLIRCINQNTQHNSRNAQKYLTPYIRIVIKHLDYPNVMKTRTPNPLMLARWDSKVD